MRILKFDDYLNIAAQICVTYENLDKPNAKEVCFVGFYEDAKAVINELVRFGYDIYNIDGLCDYTYAHYDKEFYVTLANLDGDGEIWCEQAYHKDRYLDDESDVFFIMEDCSSAIIPHCKSNALFEIQICDDDDDCECDECCGQCDCESYDEDVDTDVEENVLGHDDVHTFSVNISDENSYCYYSISASDARLLDKIAQKYLGF